MTPGMPYEAARVDGLLSQKRVTVRPDGNRLWHFQHGDVEVGVLREGGRVVATELRIPLAERSDLVREVVAEAAQLASKAGARLVDPQLGRSLVASDEGVVADQYMRTVRYAGGASGMSSETMGASSSYTPLTTEGPRGFQPGAKFFLIAIGAFFFLYLLVDSMLSGLGGR
ncbi:hypothetical protein HUA74_01825 [Myxococcus sp. CA051A]|nr:MULTISPECIES: hypothetical protein [unclassified Myxococcus]NTX00812.1 hypothetical protein [Myxococcus sp. CA040A]NTX59390.1 hypothetical protein [Myxococcus sp. CA051A]NTX12484.1 hypothetical protein [Myxococcus sp. CA056]NTX33503.1 hypothetical protein [Myxococcus sp. CA033]NTX56794.1 hypothetical protein [Myxococcus sp. CA039A]